MLNALVVSVGVPVSVVLSICLFSVSVVCLSWISSGEGLEGPVGPEGMVERGEAGWEEWERIGVASEEAEEEEREEEERDRTEGEELREEGGVRLP